MRVLHVLQSGRLSGAERVAIEIMKMFNGEINMAYASPNGQIRSVVEGMGLEFIPIDIYSKSSLKKCIENYKPDIIHAHDVRASVSCVRVTQIPVISHVHLSININKNLLKPLVYSFYRKEFAKILAVSKDILTNKNDNIITLNNVIDNKYLMDSVSKDENEYDYKIVYIGRLDDQKDPTRLLNLLIRISNKNPDIKIAILGDGKYFGKLKEFISRNGKENSIHLLGYIENPFKILKLARAMILCSKDEGYPMSILESLLLGTPVIATPVGGIPQMIRDGYDGFLSIYDDIIVEKACAILNSDKLYNYLSQHAMYTGERLNDIEEYRKCLEEIYNGCIK